jgi:Protein of unknown function with HXXEE motif
MTTTDRGLWILVAACAAHVVEEYVLDWRTWVASMSGLQPTWGRFWLMNAAFLCLAAVAALVGSKRPLIGLALPSLTLINGLLFHLGPTIVTGRVSPGVVSSVLLYVPISSWIFWCAHQEGWLVRRVAAQAVALALFVMTLPFVLLALG